MDRERSDLEDRRIFVRTRLVNEIWLEDTLGDGDMEHQHGAVTKDHQEEQSTGHVEPAGHQWEMPKMKAFFKVPATVFSKRA